MAKDQATAGWALAIGVAVFSLGMMGAVWRLEWLASGPAERITHGLTALCLLYAVLALSLWRVRRQHARVAAKATPAPPQPANPRRAPLPQATAILLGASLTLGLPSFILMLFHAVFGTVARTISFSFGSTWQARIWASGLLDLLGLTAALAIARVLTRDRRTITAIFWLGAFAGLWAALQMPASVTRMDAGVVREVATRWSSRLMAWWAILIGLFTIAGGLIEHRRRVRAWPDELWKLAVPLPAWPGFRYSSGVLGVIILVLGCVHLVQPVTAISALIAGSAMLALAHRRWEENLADVGLGLITLGVASMVSCWRPTPESQSAFFAEVFNRALVGLAIMTAVWHWLADVWTQQLDGKVAWTTTGRLIRTSRRVGYLVASTGLLVAMNLALWPLFPYSAPDTTAWRWAWGISGHLLLFLAIVFASLRTGKPTLAWLAVMAAVTAAGHVMTRTQSSPAMQLWGRHWPVILPPVATLLLLLAAAAQRSRRWPPFWEPLYLIGLLILPMAAITGASLVEQLHLPFWVPGVTFGGLAVVYLVAAWLPGPRGFLIVAMICGAVSVYMTMG